MMRKKGGAAASTSERAVRLSNAKSTKRQSRHLHLDGVHGVDRSDDFRASCFVVRALTSFPSIGRVTTSPARGAVRP